MKNILIVLFIFISLKSSGQSPIEWNDLAVKYSKEDKSKDAMFCFNKAIELKPKYSLAYHNRAELKFDLGDYYGSISDCNKAIEFAQSDEFLEKGSSYVTRGNCYLKLKDKIKACLDWSTANELGFTDALINIRNFCQ